MFPRGHRLSLTLLLHLSLRLTRLTLHLPPLAFLPLPFLLPFSVTLPFLIEGRFLLISPPIDYELNVQLVGHLYRSLELEKLERPL